MQLFDAQHAAGLSTLGHAALPWLLKFKTAILRAATEGAETTTVSLPSAMRVPVDLTQPAAATAQRRWLSNGADPALAEAIRECALAYYRIQFQYQRNPDQSCDLLGVQIAWSNVEQQPTVPGFWPAYEAARLSASQMEQKNLLATLLGAVQLRARAGYRSTVVPNLPPVHLPGLATSLRQRNFRVTPGPQSTTSLTVEW